MIITIGLFIILVVSIICMLPFFIYILFGLEYTEITEYIIFFVFAFGFCLLDYFFLVSNVILPIYKEFSIFWKDIVKDMNEFLNQELFSF